MVFILQLVQKGVEGLHVAPVRESFVPDDILAVYRNWYMTARLELPVEYVFFFHAYEGNGLIGFRIAVLPFAHGETYFFIRFPPSEEKLWGASMRKLCFV